jgi:4a-hydroxytetrahydrobiopterin dehydratase
MAKTFNSYEEPMSDVLSLPERFEALKNLSGWQEVEEGKALTKTYIFKTFPEAISFMVHISFFVEKSDHHPEWTNVYNKVHVTLTTHDCGGISVKDVALALVMDEAARL